MNIFSRVQIIREFGVREEVLIECLEQRWVRPAVLSASQGEEEFDEEDVARLRLVQQLRLDLGIEADSLPVVLQLLDQLHFMRAQVAKLLATRAEQR